jgi:hypothetical protein
MGLDGNIFLTLDTIFFSSLTAILIGPTGLVWLQQTALNPSLITASQRQLIFTGTLPMEILLIECERRGLVAAKYLRGTFLANTFVSSGSIQKFLSMASP